MIADRVARELASPAAVLALPGVSLISLIVIGPDTVTFALSVLALTFSQLVLLVQSSERDCDVKRDEAMHSKLDELLRGVPDADDTLRGIER